MNDRYKDIVSLPHPVSIRHPHMPIPDRAAQFAPFAALTGYDAAIRETARQTEQKIELDENAKMILDRKQQLLLHCSSQHPQITVTYFKPDARKTGGAYVSVSGNFHSIDPLKHQLILTDQTRIPLDDILDLESPVIDFSSFGGVW